MSDNKFSLKDLEKFIRSSGLVHLDGGFANAKTGLGTSRDRAYATGLKWSRILRTEELEELYTQHDIPARIVDLLVDDSFREGFSISFEDDENQELNRLFWDRWKELDATSMMVQAWKQARAMGWGGVYVVTEDRGFVEEPLTDPRKVTNLVLLERREITDVAEWQTDPSKQGYHKPLVYNVMPISPSGASSSEPRKIHATRVISFDGTYTPKRVMQANNGFSLSVLQRPYDVVKTYGMAWGTIDSLLEIMVQGIYKMHGLRNALVAGGGDAIRTRLTEMETTRSVNRSMIIDAENEDFAYAQVQLTGYAELLRECAVRLSAAANMPVTILLGTSPAGLNATGESDHKSWQNIVKAAQNDVLKPRLESMIKLVLADLGQAEKGFEVTFPALHQLDDQEKANLRLAQAQVDEKYITAQVLTPEEVALNRFTAKGWSAETRIDLDVREEIKTRDLEKALEDEQQNNSPNAGSQSPNEGSQEEGTEEPTDEVSE